MTKFEHSAGGVIFRRSGKEVEILLLKDKKGEWSFPNGLIEENEEKIKTAEREIGEEVGLHDLTFVDEIDSIRYFYRFQGALVRKKVDFYLFEYKGNKTPVPQKEEGISEVVWFTPEEAQKNIGYAKTNKPVLERAIQRIAYGV